MREMAFERGGGGIFAKLVNLAVFAAEMGREGVCLPSDDHGGEIWTESPAIARTYNICSF